MPELTTYAFFCIFPENSEIIRSTENYVYKKRLELYEKWLKNMLRFFAYILQLLWPVW